MNFNELIETSENKKYDSVIIREAVRAIIIIDNKILLIQSNKGDYKFPGGGLEGKENHSEGLIREVREETGYTNCILKDKVGIVVERKSDEKDSNALFQMTSHYYFCRLKNKNIITQKLDEYESAQEYSPKWVSLDEAIKQNQSLINLLEKNSWLKRETFVLKEVRKFIKR